MTQAVQARTLKTRARLVQAAEAVIAETGYAAMRVDEVVKRAGVAKGTFFAHFRDKDALMERLSGERIDHHLDDLERHPFPGSVDALVTMLLPLLRFMSSERYVFDVILRHSGAAAIDLIGPLAMTFERFVVIASGWTSARHFRDDVSPELLAEGIQSFMMNAIALQFCALHNSEPIDAKLRAYLEAWLLAPLASGQR